MKNSFESLGYVYKVFDKYGQLLLVTPVKINAIELIEKLKGSPLKNKSLVNGLYELGRFSVEIWKESEDGKLQVVSTTKKDNLDPREQTLDFFYSRKDLLKDLFD